MAYSCKIICDSISPLGKRLTTFEITFPRFELPSFNTHCLFARNSGSSRAIPVEKTIRKLLEDPFTPIKWGKNQKGMRADQELSELEQNMATHEWLVARDLMIQQTKKLIDLGVHKQIANRLLEPFLWHTVIVTATEWSNFFNLRIHPDAQPEIVKIAEMMRDVYEAGEPRPVNYGEWHLPYVTDPENYDHFDEISLMASAMRCARVSYENQAGESDMFKDAEDAGTKLLKPGHMSPFEHQATPRETEPTEYKRHGKFIGWTQFRKTIEGEWDIKAYQKVAQGRVER